MNSFRCRAQTTNWSVVLDIFSVLNQQDALKAFIWAEWKKKQLKSEQMRMFRQTRDQVEDVPCKSLLSSQQPISNRSKRELGGGKGGGEYHATAFLTKRHCRSMTYQQHIGWKSSKGSVILNYTEATFLRYQERMTFHLFCLSPTWILCVPRCIHLWRKYLTAIVIIIVIITINNTTFVLLYYKHVSIF